MHSDIKLVMQELKIIRHELEGIKEAMPDREMFLTSEEIQLLHESFENEKQGKLKSSKDLRRELGI